MVTQISSSRRTTLNCVFGIHVQKIMLIEKYDENDHQNSCICFQFATDN